MSEQIKPGESVLERIDQANATMVTILAELREKLKKSELAQINDVFRIRTGNDDLREVRRDIRYLEQTERNWSKVLANLRILTRRTI